MKLSIILGAFLVLGLANSFGGLIPRVPNDPNFVTLGRNRGYYMGLVGFRQMVALGPGAGSGRGTEDVHPWIWR
jgi:hypothetical protein